MRVPMLQDTVTGRLYTAREKLLNYPGLPTDRMRVVEVETFQPQPFYGAGLTLTGYQLQVCRRLPVTPQEFLEQSIIL